MAENDQTVTLTHNILVLDTLRKMRDAESMGNKEAYLTHYDYAFQLLVPYLAPDLKRLVEQDHKTLRDEIKKIEEDKKTLSDHGRKSDIQALRLNFAEAHKAVLFNTLTKVGIVRITEEGIIEFSKNDIDQLAGIIRGGGGLPSKIGRAKEKAEKEEKKDGTIQ